MESRVVGRRGVQCRSCNGNQQHKGEVFGTVFLMFLVQSWFHMIKQVKFHVDVKFPNSQIPPIGL